MLACIGQHAAARPAWVLLTAGGTHGHPLQLGMYMESLHLTIMRWREDSGLLGRVIIKDRGGVNTHLRSKAKLRLFFVTSIPYTRALQKKISPYNRSL